MCVYTCVKCIRQFLNRNFGFLDYFLKFDEFRDFRQSAIHLVMEAHGAAKSPNLKKTQQTSKKNRGIENFDSGTVLCVFSMVIHRYNMVQMPEFATQL